MTFPAPPVAADVDIRDFAFTPMFRARLFGSSFHARASDSEWRAGVTLWLKSWDQVPAGSLPDDDVDLCRLAELGRDLKTWKKIKAGALHGWGKCADGRLYHSVVAEGVNDAWKSKLEQRWRSECGRIKKHNQRHANDSSAQMPMPTLEQFLSLRHATGVPGDTGRMSPGTEPACPHTVPEETPSKRQGQGIIDDDDDAPERPHVIVWRKMLALMGISSDEQKWFGAMARVEMWIKQGWSAENLILPAVEKMMLSRGPLGPPGSIAYVEKAIASYAAELAKPLPEIANVNGTRIRSAKPTLDDQFAELDRLCGDGAGPLEPFADPAGGIVIDNPAQRH